MKIITPLEYIVSYQDFVRTSCEIKWQGRVAVVMEVSGREFPVFTKPTRVISYLDEYVVLSPFQELEEHKVFWKDIVNFIAPDYSRLTKPEVNLECLTEMFRLAESAGVSIEKSIVVDFGCGDGIIQSVLLDYLPKRIIGIEGNEYQRSQARKTGLRVVARWQDIKCAVDLIVGCYSIHMGCAEELFDLASRWLRPDGILLANCYKEIGIEHVDIVKYSETLEISVIPKFPSGRGPLFIARRHAQ